MLSFNYLTLDKYTPSMFQSTSLLSSEIVPVEVQVTCAPSRLNKASKFLGYSFHWSSAEQMLHEPKVENVILLLNPTFHEIMSNQIQVIDYPMGVNKFETWNKRYRIHLAGEASPFLFPKNTQLKKATYMLQMIQNTYTCKFQFIHFASYCTSPRSLLSAHPEGSNCSFPMS